MRDYIIRAEKVLYYTLRRIQFSHKLNSQAEYYFADSCDTLICKKLFDSGMSGAHVGKSTKQKSLLKASIFNTGISNTLLMSSLLNHWSVRDVSNLSALDLRNVGG